jgi:hypothetical protein
VGSALRRGMSPRRSSLNRSSRSTRPSHRHRAHRTYEVLSFLWNPFQKPLICAQMLPPRIFRPISTEVAKTPFT